MNESIPQNAATSLPVQTPAPARASKKPGEYRLFKRDTTGRTMAPDAPGYRERPYSFQIQISGKPHLCNLGTNDKTEAQARAKTQAKLLKAAALNPLPVAAVPAMALRLKPILDAYKKCGVDASAKTRQQNITALTGILQAVDLGDNPELAELTGAVVRKFFTAITAQVQAAAGDQARQLEIKRGANRRYNKARCIFVPKAIAHYQDHNLYHPAVLEFANAGKAARFTRVGDVEYNQPDDKIIEATLRAWEALEDRNLFLAIGHELAFGLRIGEMAQAKWTWWTIRAGYPVLEGEANVKGGTALIQVRALDPFFNTMRAKIAARQWRGEPEDYIIKGSDTLRTDALYRAATAWLRALGWETQKSNHALRAYAGSQVAMKYGIYEAQTFLRHSTVKVTENHYTHFVRRFKPADLETLPARWATSATSEPQLKVLQAS